MKRLTATFALALALQFGLAVAGPAGVANAAEKASHPKTTAGVEAIKKGDFDTAYQNFRTQAAKGDTEAQFELGMLYALGNGIKRDYVTAWMWTEIAARQDEPYADFIRDEVAANMTDVEVSMARQRANDWMRTNGLGSLLPPRKARR